VYTAGNPQYGQLGHGTDHETNLSHCAHPWSLPDPAVAGCRCGPCAADEFSFAVPLFVRALLLLHRYHQSGFVSFSLHSTCCAASIKIAYEPQPTPKVITTLAGCNIVTMAAGHNHAVAVDDTGLAYAWGNGGA